VYASGYSLLHWDGTGSIPIGKPLANIRLYILDQNHHLQPVGVPGELGISGDCVSRGYLNRPGLTAEKFVPAVNYLYKTGDRARWLPDGNIEYLGRIDHQVKIRGFRIELGEIEARLAGHGNIKDAVVNAPVDNQGDNYLCAYVVPVSPQSFQPGGIQQLKNYLLESLPDYMVPSYFVALEAIPLTPGKKIDRSNLPLPQHHRSKAYVSPRNEQEKKLAATWSHLLGVDKDKIGIDDNFFELGGHSLKAIGLITRIHKLLNIAIPVSKLFDFPTIRELTTLMEKSDTSVHQSIEPAEEKEYYPLTSPQKRFFLFQELHPADISYNLSEVMILNGRLEEKSFERAIKEMILRHESLRTSFRQVDGEPVQMICRNAPFSIKRFHLENVEDDSRQEKRKQIIRHFSKAFDLGQPPLLRVGIITAGEQKHYLIFDMHHIIGDGVSVGLFIKEFLTVYNNNPLPRPRLQYRDYVQWKLKRPKQSPGNNELSASEVVAEVEEVLNLPCDFVRPAAPVFTGKSLKFTLDPGRRKELDTICFGQDVTLYMLLLSTFYVFLAKISSQENIVLGSPIAGREHIDLQHIIGLFINTLVLRNFPSGGKQFTGFIKEVKDKALYAYEYQEYQYDSLVEKITAARSIGRNPLFDVMFVLQNMEMPEIDLPGLNVSRHIEEQQSSKFDMTLYAEEKGRTLEFQWEYSTKLFKEETMLRFIGYFRQILASIIENPHQKISQIGFLPDDEKRQLLYDFCGPRKDYPRDKTVYRLFEEQVARTPGETALVCGDREVTYRQLNSRANRQARVLRRKGVKANVVVALMLDRSPELITCIYAVLKAGGAYVPIDPQYPDGRISGMLKNSEATVLLTKKEIIGKKELTDTHAEVVIIGDAGKNRNRESDENLTPLSGPEDLIYIIFTSGSTGVPKGAGVFQRSFVNLMNWFVSDFRFGHSDSNLLMTSFSFDLTQKNLYASTITGGALVIPTFARFDPAPVTREIQKREITWLNCTPSMFARVVEYCGGEEFRRLKSLHYVFLGGEPILISMFMNWLESDYCRGEIVNTYGPTECTDISNAYRITDPACFMDSVVPIGKAIYNVQLHVLDQHRNILPVGIPGELCIAGDSVGAGYVNDRLLTEDKFLNIDIHGRETRIYRTGDLAKWLPEGQIEFIGRLDHQVKIRGFRVEPGEIETRLLDHEAVKEALVMPRKREGGDHYLCAYLVSITGQAKDVLQDETLKDKTLR
ncbi:MAG: amino acid adenylation domain-containing protein, partial [bacterium]|nr:amino acid adenylation domain-containing protein [bacterium]